MFRLGGSTSGITSGLDTPKRGRVDGPGGYGGIDYDKAFEPYERLGFLGQGLTGIMGGYGNQYQFQQQPNPTPLQTALGTGATLAGIYGATQAGRKGQDWSGQIYTPPVRN